MAKHPEGGILKGEKMQVGTIVKLKIDCLNNKTGTLGMVFYDYGDGFQVIFENGKYDGFHTEGYFANTKQTEADFILEKVGFESSLSGYKFKNVLQVEQDFRNGLFNIIWKK